MGGGRLLNANLNSALIATADSNLFGEFWNNSTLVTPDGNLIVNCSLQGSIFQNSTTCGFRGQDLRLTSSTAPAVNFTVAGGEDVTLVNGFIRQAAGAFTSDVGGVQNLNLGGVVNYNATALVPSGGVTVVPLPFV